MLSASFIAKKPLKFVTAAAAVLLSAGTENLASHSESIKAHTGQVHALKLNLNLRLRARRHGYEIPRRGISWLSLSASKKILGFGPSAASANAAAEDVAANKSWKDVKIERHSQMQKVNATVEAFIAQQGSKKAAPAFVPTYERRFPDKAEAEAACQSTLTRIRNDPGSGSKQKSKLEVPDNKLRERMVASEVQQPIIIKV